MKTNLYLLFTTLAIGIACFWQGCEYGKRHELHITYDTTTTSKDSLVYDTTWYAATKNHTPIPVYDTFFIPVGLNQRLIIDTAQIIHTYYTKFFYNDTIKDERISINIQDTCFKNKITNRIVNYRILRPDTIRIITKNLTQKNFEKTLLKVNIGATYTTDNKILPGLLLNYNKWSAGYSTNGTQNQLNIYYNLWKH
jgi:hypothetical protein